MKKQNKLIAFLVPVAAVIVLAESVMLISNLSNNSKIVKVVAPTVPATGSGQVAEKVTPSLPVYTVVVAGAKEMKLNQATADKGWRTRRGHTQRGAP